MNMKPWVLAAVALGAVSAKAMGRRAEERPAAQESRMNQPSEADGYRNDVMNSTGTVKSTDTWRNDGNSIPNQTSDRPIRGRAPGSTGTLKSTDTWRNDGNSVPNRSSDRPIRGRAPGSTGTGTQGGGGSGSGMDR